jgi:ABC-type uncharacterized transport system involved in gliding motility auxiliary subunit
MASHATEPQAGFSVEKLRLPLAGLGVAALFGGMATGLQGGLPEITPRVLYALGVLLIGIYVALDPEDVWAKLTGRGVLYSGNALVIAAAAIAILALFNVAASRYQTKLDLTANKQFSLSDQSVRVVQALPAPVKVTAFMLNNDQQRKQDFQTLLTEYANRSGGKLTFEFIDPEARGADAIAAGVTSVPSIVYQMGDKKQDNAGTTEKDVSTALVKLQRPGKKIYFTTGHGERSLEGFAASEYGSIKQALERDNFTPTALNLLTARTVPDDADAVVIAGATNPLLTEEKDALRAYLDGGGKLIVLLSPNSKTDLSDILQKYEVGFAGNTIVDPTGSLPQDPRYLVVGNYGSHAITKDLRDLSVYPFTTSITYPSSPASGETVTPLAQSTNNSWGNSNPQQPQRQEADPRGPLAMVVAVDAGASGGGAGKSTRLVLIGTPDLISNQVLQQVLGNQFLFLNVANWVAEQDNLIDIRAPDTTPRNMVLTGPQMDLVRNTSLIFLPLAVLAAGAAVWWTRR